jgi:hypothetical protein
VLRDVNNRVKELIISYKTIYINTYNVICLDISDKAVEDENNVIFRHESFQLWESEVTGFLTSQNLDFVTINRDGISLIALGNRHKRIIMHHDGQEKCVHSLQSANFLKVESTNYILFACAKPDKREILV